MGLVPDYIAALYDVAWCPSWSKGVVCKTIIRRFESDPRLFLKLISVYLFPLFTAEDAEDAEVNFGLTP